MNMKTFLWLGVVISAIGTFAFMPRSYVGACEIDFTGGTGCQDADFRARCVCAEMTRSDSHEKLADEILQLNVSPVLSMEEILRLLGSVEMSVHTGATVMVSVCVRTDSRDLAKQMVELLAELIVRRIENERTSLEKNMEKWFDTQLYHMRKRGENVDILERERTHALEDAARNAVRARVRKTEVFKSDLCGMIDAWASIRGTRRRPSSGFISKK